MSSVKWPAHIKQNRKAAYEISFVHHECHRANKDVLDVTPANEPGMLPPIIEIRQTLVGDDVLTMTYKRYMDTTFYQ